MEDSAHSSYRGLSVAVNKRFSNEITALASYTLSKVTDDASDFSEQPQNPFDRRSERALSLQDVRHRLVVSGVFELPFGDAEDKAKGGKDSLLTEVFGNIEIAPIITLSSGRPANALTGIDEERSGAFPLASRPFGFSRNVLPTPNFFKTDLRVVKYVPLPVDPIISVDIWERANLLLGARESKRPYNPSVNSRALVFSDEPPDECSEKCSKHMPIWSVAE